MINAVHAIIYSRDAEAARAFFRDTLKFPFADAGEGWLIFALPPAELGIHPTESTEAQKHQGLYLMCDDLESTMEELKAKGVEFTSDIDNKGWGRIATLKIPGGGDLSLYQPRHATPRPSGKELPPEKS